MVRKSLKSQDEEIILSAEDVWSVLEFSRALAGNLYPGILTPDLINQRLKDISYSPLVATESSLNDSLNDPKNSEESLRNFVENFELVSMPFKRILSYMASHLALDLTYTSNADYKDYKTSKFQKEQKIVFDYLDRFDYKDQFRNAIKQMLRNELFVATVREDGEKVVLQELPLQYIKITARWDYGLLAAFNFYYFLQPGVDIELYPPFFKKKYREIFGGNSKNTSYRPSLPVESRGNSQYVYWVDLPPDVGWVFKLDKSLITAVPYFAALMPDLINQNVMRALQKDINMANATKMVFGQVPLLKETKSSVKDMIAIDPKTLGQFLNLVKASLSNAIKVASAPLEDIKAVSFDENNKLYDEYLRTALSSSGMNTSLIYSGQTKANLVDSQLSFQSDSKIMEQQLYPQFESFLNYWINKKLKFFRYNFKFEGNDYYLDREQRIEKQMNLMKNGIVLPQKIAAALGMKPQEFYRMLDEAKANDFVKNYVVSTIMNAQQQSPGRPSESDDKLGESGAQSREAGGNESRNL